MEACHAADRGLLARPAAALLALAVALATAPGAALIPAHGAPEAPPRPHAGGEDAPGAWLADRDADAPVEAIVRLDGPVTPTVAREAEAAGLATHPPLPAMPSVFAVRGSAEDVRAFLDRDDVRDAEPNRRLAPALDSSRTAAGAASVTGNLPGRGGPALVDGDPVDGSGTTVAVVDVGIDATHPDLAYGDTVVANKQFVCSTPVVVHEDRHAADDRYCWGNWLASNPTRAPGVCETRDDPFWVEVLDGDATSGHGTHVASLAAGTGEAHPDGALFRGVAPGASVYGFGMGAAGTLIGAYHAFSWILCHPDEAPIDVVNNSWAPLDPCERETADGIAAELVDRLVENGTTVVFAAGNDAGGTRNACTNPLGSTATPGVLLVGNYDDEDRGTVHGSLAGWSSTGEAEDPVTWPDLSAPGTLVTGARATAAGPAVATGLPEPRAPATYVRLTGTSMAAPHVAGAAALLVDTDPTLTPAEVERALEAAAHPFGAGYEDDPHHPTSASSYDKGHGLLDVRAALEHLDAAREGLRLDGTDPGPAFQDGTRYLATGPTGVGELDGDYYGWTREAPEPSRPSTWRDPIMLTGTGGLWIPATLLHGDVRLDGANVTVAFHANGAASTLGFDQWTVELRVGDVHAERTSTAPALAGTIPHSVTFEDVTARDRSLQVLFDSGSPQGNADNALLYDSPTTPTRLSVS